MSVSVCILALVIRQANHIFSMLHSSVTCSLSGSTTFLNIIS